jgi:hypothetical protein
MVNITSCYSYPLAPASHQKIAMAPGQKLYPRATVKKIIKAHSNRNVSKNVDVMVRGIVGKRVATR